MNHHQQQQPTTTLILSFGNFHCVGVVYVSSTPLYTQQALC